MKRVWIYAVAAGLALGCRSAMVRGDEEGCEEGALDGVAIAELDRSECSPPNALRETYGLRGCGVGACKKDKFRDGHRDGWERCYVDAYNETYPVQATDCEDTGVPQVDDTCEPLRVGEDQALRSNTLDENFIDCTATEVSQMVVDQAGFDALFVCDTGLTPPPSGVDWDVEDAWVEFGQASGLGVHEGVYVDTEGYHLVRGPCSTSDAPAPLFRTLRITALPLGVVVTGTETCTVCE